jgi:hypothetical protein
MKRNVTKNTSANKRTQILKSILEEREINTAIDNQELVLEVNKSKPISLIDIAEDLIKDAPPAPNQADATSPTRIIQLNAHSSCASKQDPNTLAKSIELFHSLISKELVTSAAHLGLDEAELQAWVDLQIEVPAKTILVLLRTMQNLHLDPLNEEIGFVQYDDGGWQVLITIEGCSKLLNQHPQFNGLVFHQANTLIDGIPEWIECSIYRKDRILPTTVREYLTEVRGESTIWQKMPRRMLRHRALQQCVRLAIV